MDPDEPFLTLTLDQIEKELEHYSEPERREVVALRKFFRRTVDLHGPQGQLALIAVSFEILQSLQAPNDQ